MATSCNPSTSSGGASRWIAVAIFCTVVSKQLRNACAFHPAWAGESAGQAVKPKDAEVSTAKAPAQKSALLAHAEPRQASDASDERWSAS